MMLCCSSLRTRIRSWLRDYDQLQSVAVILIYIQIGCSLIGSLGAFFNGVLLINLAIALFALVAIESSSQRLGRTYAVLLCCALLLDISWLILFSHQIWSISSEQYTPFLIFSLRLALWMQILGFSVRLTSSLLWIQMYRLGVSCVDNTISRESDFDLRSRFLNPSASAVDRQTSQNSDSDSILGGSIYDPAYYSSLFEDAQDNGMAIGVNAPVVGGHSGYASTAGSPQLKACNSKSFQLNNVGIRVQCAPEHLIWSELDGDFFCRASAFPILIDSSAAFIIVSPARVIDPGEVPINSHSQGVKNQNQ